MAVVPPRSTGSLRSTESRALAVERALDPDLPKRIVTDAIEGSCRCTQCAKLGEPCLAAVEALKAQGYIVRDWRSETVDRGPGVYLNWEFMGAVGEPWQRLSYLLMPLPTTPCTKAARLRKT